MFDLSAISRITLDLLLNEQRSPWSVEKHFHSDSCCTAARECGTDILLDDDVPQDERGVEGEAAGFREGEWMEIKVICTARVPIVNIVLGGFPFLRYDDAYAAAIAEASDTSTQAITFECDVSSWIILHILSFR